MQGTLRALDRGDEVLLRDYLYLALFVPDGEPPLPTDIIEQPAVAKYVNHDAAKAPDCTP